MELVKPSQEGITSAWVLTTLNASSTARAARISEAPSRTGSSGRKESDRYSKNASMRAFLPRAFARTAALTSASDWPPDGAEPPPAICGRFMMSLYTPWTAPPMMIW